MNFDWVARPYRWGEYCTFGSALARCRRAALPFASGCREALVIGDGDGRFTEELLAAEPQLQVDSLDFSASMLHLAAKRTRRFSERIRFHRADARRLMDALSANRRYDFVATHFFLDCLTTAEVHEVASVVRGRLEPGARWCISEFATPNLFSRAVVRVLYLAFQILTGLGVNQLPDYQQSLEHAGFRRTAFATSWRGLLVTSCWQATTLLKQDSHCA